MIRRWSSTTTRVASSPHASGGPLLTTVTMGSLSSTAAGRSGRPRTVRPPPKSPIRSWPSSPLNPGAAGGRTPRRSSPRARAATPTFSMRATRGSTPVPWREGRPERGVYQGPPTSTPIASSTPRAVPSTPTRSWRGGWRRRVCPRIETSLSSPTATAGSRPRFRSLPCTGSVTSDWPTTTARGTSGVSGRICPRSVEQRDQRAESDFGVRISGGMKKFNVHSSRARNVISWVLSLLMILAGAALIASFFLAGRLDSTATNSDNPGGFNVPKLETTNGENTSSTGPSDKTLELTVPSMARIENDEVPYTAGNDEEALKTHAAIHLEGTGFPWDNEANVYIAGHRLGYPNTESWLTFWDLSDVVGGDKIYVTDANGTEYTYNVFKTFVVSPSDTQVTDTMPGKNILTLQSCTLPDYGERLIVQAELIDTSEKAA